MLRAGVVKHPLEWNHGGIQELLGTKQRYCIINKSRLLRALGFKVSEFVKFKDWYIATLNTKLACISQERQAYWSEAIAVGDVKWLEKQSGEINKSKARIYPASEKVFYLYHRKRN